MALRTSTMTPEPTEWPVKPGDWIADPGERVAKVKAVWWDGREVLVDLFLFARDGERLGRVSPAMGGPKTFEPSVPFKGWRRIAPPAFPITLKWVPKPDGSGVVAMFYAGDGLPDRQWKRPKRKALARIVSSDGDLVAALKAIADGHNDARTLARQALARRGAGA